MKRLITTGTILILLSTMGIAAENSLDNLRSIQVTGEGEVNVAPDRVVMTFGIETVSAKLKDAQQENARRTQAVMEALKGFKIAPKDIQTGFVRIEPRYHFSEGGKRRLMDYSASKTFTVTISDLSNYGGVVSAVLDAGVDSVGGLRFESSQMDRLETEARKRAVMDARERAETLAQAAGGKVGRPLRIEEQNMGGPVYPMARFKMAGEALRVGNIEDSVAPGEVTIRANVSVRFELN